MADKRMNQFTPATDMEYVYAELADGSQVKIKKSDLAKNIGEIMQELRLFPYNTYKWGEWCTDCNIPNGFTGVGLLSSFALQEGSYVMQFLCGLNDWKLYFRFSSNKNDFFTWRLINLT